MQWKTRYSGSLHLWSPPFLAILYLYGRASSTRQSGCHMLRRIGVHNLKDSFLFGVVLAYKKRGDLLRTSLRSVIHRELARFQWSVSHCQAIKPDPKFMCAISTHYVSKTKGIMLQISDAVMPRQETVSATKARDPSIRPAGDPTSTGITIVQQEDSVWRKQWTRMQDKVMSTKFCQGKTYPLLSQAIFFLLGNRYTHISILVIRERT